MDGTREPVVVTLAEKLTGNHSTTGTKADAKTNCELRKGQRGLNATKRDLATELPVVVTLAEKLTGNHSTTGTKADAKTNCELRKGQRGLNATKRDLATELPDDIRVDKGIGLLEKGAEENGHAEGKKLTPNDTLRYVDRTIPGTFRHAPLPLFLSLLSV